MNENQARIVEIENNMAEPDFWSNKDYATEMVRELEYRKKIEEKGDPLLGANATVTILAGAGGDDSEDFVRMLKEMYESYAEKNSMVVSIQNQNENTMSGYRSITLRIEGDSVFDKLRYESGVHRLIRLSPFNAKGKRQTSFALVEVVPIVPKQAIQIKDSDLEIQFTRSGGPGGQNVNKRETAVRITHIPSGVSVHADGERTQEANRESAMEILRGKVMLIEQEKNNHSEDAYRISKTTENEWGSQIRTYTLHPYQLVKDHRTGIESGNVDKVLNEGDIYLFTEPLRHTK